MSTDSDRIEHVSDTALMVAACRALETVRPDGFVRDPLAERLAGPRGMAIARAMSTMGVEMMCFGVGMRCRFLEDLILRCLTESPIATVLSLGCGLDSRPWRLDLPPDLRWIEDDFEDMLDYKAARLGDEPPKCRLERMAADLTVESQRRAVFAAAGDAPALMITEGLLMYLPAATVDSLAEEPARLSGIRYWMSDVTTSAMRRLTRMDQFQGVDSVRDPSHLNGEEMLEVFARHGWTTLRRHSYITEPYDFAASRIRKMMGLPEGAVLPPPPLPGDPSGAYLFVRP